MFVVALLGLLLSARSGQNAMVVWVVFAIFISVSTVWLRGQYADSLDGRQWVIPYRIGWLLGGVAAVLLLLAFTLPGKQNDKGLLGIGALVLVYLVGGSALTQARQSCTIRMLNREIHTRRCGRRLTVAGLVVAVAGAFVLGELGWIGAGAAMIGLGVLGLLPVGMALWSEQAIRWVCEKERPAAWLWGLGAGGAGLFVLAALGSAGVSHSAWLLPVLLVLGLLVAALVSTTQADVVGVMAAVALMGVTPAQMLTSDSPDPGDGQRVLVAFGDSYMSGEGAAVYYSGTDDGGFKEGTEDGGRSECRRAPSAWAALVTQDRMTFDGLKFMACSGARAPGVINQVKAYHDEVKSYVPAMVVVSLGGNDAGFASIGEMCLAPGDCSSAEDMWMNSFDVVKQQLRLAYGAVDQEFKRTPVVVVPYPDPIHLTGKQCDQVALTDSEQLFIHQFVERLNDTIRDTAREFGFIVLDAMPGALEQAHLQLCDPRNDGRPGVNFIGLRSVRGVATQRFNPTKWMHTSLHPNERGHIAMLRVFQRWFLQYNKEPRLVREDHDDAAKGERVRLADGSAPAKPQCDLSDTSTKNCRTEARRWAAQQVGKRLIHDALCLWIAGAAGGAWMVAVAFFAYRRRVHAACG
ncbi:GDSL-type esterase/lipase family protein [Actinoplanes sp. NPDC020271]|uniref:GDSL-type esterase/lipase family protein n=1 Tax=Actinoplanes sp. NPDC020271 TaxID=3363896 RepID=UPI0037A35019